MSSNLKPWEEKTIEKLTVHELIEWVNWYSTKRTGPVVFNADLVVHNVLLWERMRSEREGKAT